MEERFISTPAGRKESTNKDKSAHTLCCSAVLCNCFQYICECNRDVSALVLQSVKQQQKQKQASQREDKFESREKFQRGQQVYRPLLEFNG